MIIYLKNQAIVLSEEQSAMVCGTGQWCALLGCQSLVSEVMLDLLVR